MLVDDHPIMMEGLARLLEPEYIVAGRLTSGEELLESVRELDPDVILLDHQLPGLDGAAVLRRLEEEAVNARVVVLSMHESPEVVAAAMDAGAAAFVVKAAASAEVLTAITEVLEGRTYVSHAVQDALNQWRASTPDPRDEELVVRSLTPRQKEIIRSLCAGEVAKQTANRLGVSRKTVEYHKYRVMRRLGYRTSAELIRFAVRHGLDG